MQNVIAIFTEFNQKGWFNGEEDYITIENGIAVCVVSC